MLPIFHTAWWPILVHHCAGGKGVIVKRFDFNEILGIAEQERVTHINMVPILFSWILDFPDLDKYDLSSIKYLHLCRGSHARGPHAAPARKVRPHLPAGLRAHRGRPLATILMQEDQCRLEGPPELTRRISSAGRESLVTEVRVVDEDDNEVPPGEVGEIIVRGKNIMRGYWKDPELTAKALRDGWLHTGDLAQGGRRRLHLHRGPQDTT